MCADAYIYVIKMTCKYFIPNLGAGFGDAQEEYLTYFPGACTVNELGGRLTRG